METNACFNGQVKEQQRNCRNAFEKIKGQEKAERNQGNKKAY